jgi:hypothetical protein
MVNLFQILNQFVLLFRKNVIEKSSMIWRVLPLVKINTRTSETPCISFRAEVLFVLRVSVFNLQSSISGFGTKRDTSTRNDIIYYYNK